jgi:hypothetical protein
VDIAKLTPILNKESILKTANARELEQSPQDVLQRYTNYAMTHIPLGDTTKQLRELERVIVDNKHCAIGTIVGPYGYGKTSTAVHLWNELREQHILAIPPFLWINLAELMDAVYYWLRFEFTQGPKTFIEPLERLYDRYRESYKQEIFLRIGDEVAQELLERGALILEIRARDIVAFFSEASGICEQAGYKGMVIFTDELQQTLAQYKPSRDAFFADLFEIVKDVIGLEGHWAMILSMDNDTEGIITRLRADILARLQRSALYFRVRDMYNRREYPAELWSAFEQRFGFNGNEIISPYTLDSIGQIAARNDLGAGPRMVTQAFALAIKFYEKTDQPYTPIQFVNDFLAGQLLFDQLGKFPTAVKKALENNLIKNSEANQEVVKLLAAYPMGCSEKIMDVFGHLADFREFPPLARRELVMPVSGGYTLRYLAEDTLASENIVQRLTTEFASRFSPGKSYATRAAEGFLAQVVLQAFAGWKSERGREVELGGTKYQTVILQGSPDPNYPERIVAVLVAAVPHSLAPTWKKTHEQADIELRFELNYNVTGAEPGRLIISPSNPQIAVFQLNILSVNTEGASRIIPNYLFDYYPPEQWNSLLALSLIDYLFKNKGDVLDDQNRITSAIQSLRQYTLLVLLGEHLETASPEFASRMVGLDKIKDLLRKQCQQLYPRYKTLMTNSKWKENLQQYRFAIGRLKAQNELSIARGRRPYVATKEEVAETFAIPGRRLTNIEPLLENLKGLVVKEDFSGRTASSQVKLRFRLHPLEEDLLEQLDNSTEKVKRNGLEVPKLPAELMLRHAKKEGYTDAEVGEILFLLKERSFVDLDQHNNLIRTVDAVDDLREAVQGQLKVLEDQVRTLADALPDFESGAYPLSKLRTQLEGAKDRDQLESVKADIRLHSSTLSAFAGRRKAVLVEDLRNERYNLHQLIKDGIPPWLRNPFGPSPLQDLLEKQRRDLASEYQALLDEIRMVHENSSIATRSSQGSLVEELIATYTALQDLTKQSRKLTTRLKSYQDRQEDFDAWRRVSSRAADLENEATNADQVYNNKSFKSDVDQLWASLRKRFEAQPLSFISGHRAVAREIEKQMQVIARWLDNRREDFDDQCLTYQQLLATAHIRAELKIPFDKERPADSQMALIVRVKDYVESYFVALYSKLKSSLQVIRYGSQVQNLCLTDAENRANHALQAAEKLKAQINFEVIGNSQQFKARIINPLNDLVEEEKKLAEEVQEATQQRPAHGRELRLLDLMQNGNAGQEIDLRELIIRLMDQKEEKVNLDALIHDLEALFQKNLVDIRINLSRRGKY